MKRLLSILLVTIIIGLIAFAFLWIKNEEVAQQVSEFNPMRRLSNRSVATGAISSGSMMSGEMMSGATMSGMNMTGTTTTGTAASTGAMASGEAMTR